MGFCCDETGLIHIDPDAGIGATIGITILNVLLLPILLIIHSIRIYLVPCICTYTLRCCCWLCCKICTCGCWIFEDKDFAATSASLGNLEADVGSKVQWKRGAELRADTEKHNHPFLFEGKIEPDDIVQGALGDCWLLSAFATAAEHPGLIQSVFLQREFNPRGKYDIRLYDALLKRKVTVTIDDRIPCNEDSGKPLFSQPHGDELWCLLLEKAFAKFCGSYHALEGGQVMWALEAMTGCVVTSFSPLDGESSWTQLELIHKPTDANKRKCVMGVTKNKYESDRMYEMFKSYHKKGCIMGAGSKGKDETLTEGRGKGGGIVPGHAYSIIKVYESFGHKLLKLRNPWGTFVWDGDWSWGSNMWSKHPQVKGSVGLLAGGTKDNQDGEFWMSWGDFCKNFDSVDICVVSTGLDDLYLDIHEDCGCLGPTAGCITGCAWFWCACQGVTKMYCHRDGSDENEAKDLESQVADGGSPPSEESPLLE